MTACVLVCSGFEPSGRVGLLADLAAVATAGARAHGVVTTLTAQGRGFRATPVPPATVRAQVEAALADARFGAVKVGVVPSRQHWAALRRALADHPGWWVVDPVVRTSRGEPLSRLSPGDVRGLAHHRVVLTPNLPELAWLTGTADEPVAAAQALVALGFGAVVVKGGHARGRAVDWVVRAGRVTRLDGPKLRRTAGHRGTGCRFASTLAAELAKGASVETAARAAKHAVARYLKSISGPASGAP